MLQMGRMLPRSLSERKLSTLQMGRMLPCSLSVPPKRPQRTGKERRMRPRQQRRQRGQQRRMWPRQQRRQRSQLLRRMKEATGMLMLQSRGISSIPLRWSAILTYLLLPECEICCQGRPPAGRVVCLSDLRVHCSVMRERTSPVGVGVASQSTPRGTSQRGCVQGLRWHVPDRSFTQYRVVPSQTAVRRRRRRTAGLRPDPVKNAEW